MKTRKTIQDAFDYNAGGASLASELQTADITSMTTYPGDINDVYVYYTESGDDKRISFTDGEEVITTTTTTAAPTTTTTTTR
jgi:hypothetical protein